MFTSFFTIFAVMLTKGKNRLFNIRRFVAMSLLILPVLLSLTGAGVFLSSLSDSLFFQSDNAEVSAFRANIIVELFGALFSLSAFVVLLPFAADKAIRRALRLLVASELYMLLYWAVSYVSPVERYLFADMLGSSVLLLATIVCCYAWSLLLGNKRMGAAGRSWSIFIYLSYIFSFVAFYAPLWQRFIPEGSPATYLPENSPAYIMVASLLNIIRCVAIKYFVYSPLFVNKDDSTEPLQCGFSPFNRFLLAVFLAAFFIVNALAFVYKNVHFFAAL